MERLWLTEPERATALANVRDVRRGRFTLDRGLYAPKSQLYLHPQEPDRGVVWTPRGEKRKLAAVVEEAGVVWHRLRDAVPQPGDRLQCHLDPDRRLLTSRAHTALHLYLHAAGRDLQPLAVAPEVRGGGTVRLVLDAPWVDPTRLAAILQRVNAWCQDDRRVRREPLPRDVAPHRLAPQRIVGASPYPGPETVMDGVFIDGIGGLPCDGTHVARTSAIGQVVARQIQTDREGRLMVGLMVRTPS